MTKEYLKQTIILLKDISGMTTKLVLENVLNATHYHKFITSSAKQFVKKFAFLFFITLSSNLFGEDPKIDSILREGKLLYRLEKASWFATDDFMAFFPNLRDSIGGYLSYETDSGYINAIFFSRSNPDYILIRYQYDSLPKQKAVFSDILNHTASTLEKELIKLRKDAFTRCSINQDRFYKYYQNTSFNLIPLITKNERKVYFITGPKNSGSVLIGNDYLLKYDEHNNFLSQERIHNSLIPLPSKLEKDAPSVATMHSHIISDYIDPTDICTLLLYKEFVDWKIHYVLSQDYVSIFDLEKETLTIMTRKAWEKMINSTDTK